MINFLFVGNNHRQIIKYFLKYLLHLQHVEIRNTIAKLMKFDQLSEILKITNERLYSNAIKAVNINLTLRNWIFGFYIVEFEQNGEERAVYGRKLLQNLADTLKIKGLSAPELSRCRQFYQTYPKILRTLPQEFKSLLPV